MGVIYDNDVYGFGWSFIDGRIFTASFPSENNDKDKELIIKTIHNELNLLSNRDRELATYVLYRKSYCTYDDIDAPPNFYLWIPTDINTFNLELQKLSIQ